QFVVRALGLRVGSEGALRRAGEPGRAGQGAAQRIQPRAVPPGDREAGRAAQHVHPGARALVAYARCPVQPQDRHARAPDVHGRARADRRRRHLPGLSEDGAAAAAALPDRARHREGTRLDRADEGGPAAQVSQGWALEAAGARLAGFVEVKSLAPQFDERLFDALSHGPNPSGYAVHSFDHRIIRRLGLERPALPRGVLSSSYLVRPLAALEDAGATT